MIELRAVSQRFQAHTVLYQLDLTLTERRIGVVGGNGSGKSTFARLLNGLQIPTEGVVKVDGLDTSRHGREVRQRVGFVFQNPDNQIVMPLVDEDLAFGLRCLRLPRAELEVRLDAVLALHGLSACRDQSAHLLSGGQKQMLAIAGVLVMQPRYIVFDEPTTLLDLRNTRRVARTIAELPQTAIVVSHDLELLRDFDRVLVFQDGRLVDDDRPDAALTRYAAAMA
ncbi:MAG TPA: ABC transporter ATP-binding protein [Acetobacteraceae bacterium]|jgi:biotin transport system ATP-binding protein|nr:ABC transporter ATP-binding protein [Acetobacteraceae bacterium]